MEQQAPGYTPRDVVRLTGVPYSTLNLWAKQGFIRPSIRDAKGTGSERIYSKSDIEALHVAKLLRNIGFNFGVIDRAISKLNQYPRSKRVEVQLCWKPEIYVSIRRPE